MRDVPVSCTWLTAQILSSQSQEAAVCWCLRRDAQVMLSARSLMNLPGSHHFSCCPSMLFMSLVCLFYCHHEPILTSMGSKASWCQSCLDDFCIAELFFLSSSNVRCVMITKLGPMTTSLWDQRQPAFGKQCHLIVFSCTDT